MTWTHTWVNSMALQFPTQLSCPRSAVGILKKTRAKSLSLHSFFSTLWYYYKSQSSFVASTVAQCELVETRVNMRISKDFQWFSFLFSCVPGKRRRCKNMLATSQLKHWSILWKSGYMMTTLEWHACMRERTSKSSAHTYSLMLPYTLEWIEEFSSYCISYHIFHGW